MLLAWDIKWLQLDSLVGAREVEPLPQRAERCSSAGRAASRPGTEQSAK